MPRNGSGTYNRTQSDYVTDTVISETAVNSELNDIATALTNSLSKDGQTTPTGNQPMATFKHTGVGNATARTDYAAAGQVQDGALSYAADAGAADAYAITLSPAITAYASGQKFTFKATNANTGASTIDVNAVGAKAIKKQNDQDLESGDIEAGQIVEIEYDGTNFQMLSPSAKDFGALAYKSTVATADIDANSVTGPKIAMGSDAQGDVLFYDGTDYARLAAGTSGQVLKTQGAGSDPAWSDEDALIALSAEQATTSGTSFDFTSIPAGVRTVRVLLNGVSLSGNDDLLIQLGTSGGVVTSGYVSRSVRLNNLGNSEVDDSTSGIIVKNGALGHTHHGVVNLYLQDGANHTWVSDHSGSTSATTCSTGGGSVTLSGELTQLRLTRTGSNTFDAGSASIQYSK
tara:strand:+ start:8853 stop:10061 length:1209 start_codon:yes stop_codon:yes gene_type:complete